MEKLTNSLRSPAAWLSIVMVLVITVFSLMAESQETTGASESGTLTFDSLSKKLADLQTTVEKLVILEGTIAVLTTSQAYVWNEKTHNWTESANLSGKPIQILTSEGNIGILTTEKAYAWSKVSQSWSTTENLVGDPIDILGSQGNLAVLTTRRAYAWSKELQSWSSTGNLTGNPLRIIGSSSDDIQIMYEYIGHLKDELSRQQKDGENRIMEAIKKIKQ